MVGLPSKILNEVVSHSRRTNTVNSVGDFTESWSVLQANIPCSFQPIVNFSGSKEIKDSQGASYSADYVLYTNISIFQNIPKEFDRITTSDSEVYDIVKIEKNLLPGTGKKNHHYKILLQKIKHTS